MTTRLDGRRIVVTGGSSGMGAALVRSLPQLGARLVSLDVAEPVAGTGPSVHCDVRVAESVNAAMTAAIELLGGLDVLVHAAGIAPVGSGAETSVELWHSVMAVNALGTMLTNQAAFRVLREHGGSIVNFASGAGVNGYPGKAAYAASKGAVVAWTRTIAVEWAAHAITVNAVVPAIWTPMYDRTRAAMNAEDLAAHDAVMRERVALGGRLGDLEQDFVPVLAFLCSPGARFMTGQLFAVDGGMLMVR